MKATPYIFLAFFLGLFVAGTYLRVEQSPQGRLNEYRDILEDYVQEQEKAIQKIVESPSFSLLSFDQQNALTKAELRQRQVRLERLNQSDFTLLLYQQDSLVFWTNNQLLPPQEIQASSDKAPLRWIANGFYYAYRPLLSKEEEKEALALIPLKYEYRLRSDYLKDHFPASQRLPVHLVISEQPSDFPITSIGGQVIAYLQEGSHSQPEHLLFSIWLLFAAFFCLAVFLHLTARSLNQKHGHWVGTSVLIMAVLIIRFLTIILDATATYEGIPLFSTPLDIPFNPSLGDLLINLVLVLWILFFLLGQRPRKSLSHKPLPFRLILALLSYLAVSIAVLFVLSTLKLLVLNTPLEFSSSSIFNLPPSSWMAMTGIILLMVALFLFAHRRLLDIKRTELLPLYRFPTILLVAALTWPIQMHLVDLHQPTWTITAVIGFLLLAFDLFEHNRKWGFLWLVIWLILLSTLPAYFIFQYNLEKGKREQLAYAEALANPKDAMSEKELLSLSRRLERSPELYHYFQSTKDSFYDPEPVHRLVNEKISDYNYLFYNYQFHLYAFINSGRAAFKEHAGKNRRGILNGIKQTESIGGDLYFGIDRNKRPLYFSLHRYKYLDHSVELLVTYRHKRKSRSKVYTELLVDRPYRNLSHLDQYAFHLYAPQGSLIDQQRTTKYKPGKDQYQPGAPPQLVTVGQQRIAFYQNPMGYLAVVASPKFQGLQLLDLFCFCFGLFVLLAILVAAINSLLRVMPKTLNLSLLGKPSLRRRIQLAIFGLTVGFFLTTGIVTVQFFQNSTAKYHDGRLDRKTLSVLNDARHELELLPSSSEQQPPIQTFAKHVDDLSSIHRMDINLFDLQGNLVRSSEEDLFTKGIQARKMNPAAYHALHHIGGYNYESKEYIGSLEFITAYVSLFSGRGSEAKPLGYLGLPYYSKRRELRSDVNQFMDNLLYVYVFCLLGAVLISVLVANSITSGLRKVSQNLGEFRLDGPNKRMEITSQDEMGQLAEVYNKMVGELERSAQALAQSERESAWREMAKQVAHEIKNPLTPMKLSIQYLMHAYQSDPQQIEPKLQRVSQTLIEQIDSLARIATEFSDFAKMPKPTLEPLALNDLLTSAIDLFRKNEQEVDIQLHMPAESIYVLGDTQHLNSVFNNLLKNAQEAIPDERRGEVDVFLRRLGDKVVVQVKDNGTGIPPEIQPSVFQPNFTTKGSGTGLGLAICRNFIRSFNGELYFQTKEGKGTSFFVELPILEGRSLRAPDTEGEG